MPIQTFRFISLDDFKTWDEIDPILQNAETYNDNFINQALNRATTIINRYANKKGKNFLKLNWDNENPELPESSKIEIRKATAIQAQYYLINTTYYEHNNSSQHQGSISFTESADTNYFLIPEVKDILKDLDLIDDIIFNEIKEDKLNNNILNEMFIHDDSHYSPYLRIKDGDSRYILFNNGIINLDGSISIEKKGLPFNQYLELKINNSYIKGFILEFKSSNKLSTDSFDVLNGEIITKAKTISLKTINNEKLEGTGNIPLQIPLIAGTNITIDTDGTISAATGSTILELEPNSSGRNNADLTKTNNTYKLRIWDPSFGGGKNTADYDLMESGDGWSNVDKNIGTIAYISKFFYQKTEIDPKFNDYYTKLEIDTKLGNLDVPTLKPFS